jgi:hypothetical protein
MICICFALFTLSLIAKLPNAAGTKGSAKSIVNIVPPTASAEDTSTSTIVLGKGWDFVIIDTSGSIDLMIIPFAKLTNVGNA